MTAGVIALSHPTRFLKLTQLVVPATAGVAIVLGGIGLWLALVASPPDFDQGHSVRIMYVHVPAAWMAMAIYAAMAGSSVMALIWRMPMAFLLPKAIAPLGVGMTVVCLATGSLWGAPTWGTWWVWDARLTSVLILLFLYLGYIALVHAFDDPGRGLQAGAILSIVGVINLPVIKFSVDWWNTLHQPASVSRIGVPAIDPSMLTPLLVMAAAFMMLTVALAMLRLAAEVAERKAHALRLRGYAPGVDDPDGQSRPGVSMS